jgi:hypothetical protein
MPTNQTDKKLAVAWAAFVTLHAKTPHFRRSEIAEFLAQRLAGTRRPTREQREVAAAAADRFMKEARKAEKPVKSGHVHWRFSGVEDRTRKLIDGRVIAEFPEVCTLTLKSRCPTKWLSVDLETGDVWQSDEAGCWTNATPETIKALKLLVENS